ncbi:MAG: ATP-dependent Clp protease ATP-binding subunit [Planctomycetes bacterium]|nr:ATP-dependent Clp protease ATP-binding subunit [Planctomycetota bacterium]
MPRLAYSLVTLARPLQDGLVLAEALCFPEVSRAAASALRARRALALSTVTLASETPVHARHMRVPPAVLETVSFPVVLPAPKESLQWKEPLALTLHAVLYRAAGLEIAAVPGLGIEVLAPTREELLKQLPLDALAALRRAGAAEQLSELAALPLGSELVTDRVKLFVDVPSPRDVARGATQARDSGAVLAEVADDLCDTRLPEAWQVEPLVRQLAELLGGRNAQSVLLVGPPGVGKTALVHELVRDRARHGFADTRFWATSGSRLVAGMSGFGMWQERCNRVCAEARKQGAILHLGALAELMEVGKGKYIQQGVAGFLRPYIARGELRCVVECTPEQLAAIERRDPHLLGAFARLEVPQPSPADCDVILRKAAAGRNVTQAALDTLSRLHRRHATYSAWPGRPLRFLRNLLADHPDAPPAAADVVRAFSRETGLPRDMLDEHSPLDLAAVRAFLGSRVIGQDHALELVTDLLATIKAGLSRPRRPLASLLFVGPTGVGKTETAKALAEYLFSDRKRVARLDMSEYASPGAVQRLIGGPHGEGLLVARMREEPFSVLLLDEFEKAHPLFFDLLLQILGEARLTDSLGRLADFTNCVVIMTSNLGAESFMAGRIGFGETAPDALEHFTGALRRFVRPELLNRMDRVVPFLPLPPDAVRRVLHKELELVHARPGLRDDGTAVTLTPEAEHTLVAAAFQPELGARPLKRELERRLLVPLAELLNTGANRPGRVLAAAAAGTITLQPGAQPEGNRDEDQPLAAAARECVALRRKAQTADRAPAVLELRNECFRIRKRLDQQERAKHRKPGQTQIVERDRTRLQTLEQITGAFTTGLQRLAALEDDLALHIARRVSGDTHMLRARLEDEQRHWQSALLGLLRLRYAAADIATLQLSGPNHDLVFDLGRAYATWASGAGMATRVIWASHEPTSEDIEALRRRAESDAWCRAALEHWQVRGKDGEPLRLPQANALKFLAEPREEPGLLLIEITAPDAMLRLGPEQGTHLFESGAPVQLTAVVVRTIALSALSTDALEPAGGTPPVRRSYNFNTRQARDESLGTVLAWTGGRLDSVVARGIEGAFVRALEGQVGL